MGDTYKQKGRHFTACSRASLLPAACAQRNAPIFNLGYSEADVEVFRPAGATRCMVEGLLHAKFHPIGTTIRIQDPQTGDDCRLLGANGNQWRPVNFITTIITGHDYKRHPGNFYWALFFHTGFSLLWKFYWAGASLRTVSLRDVNSLG